MSNVFKIIIILKLNLGENERRPTIVQLQYVHYNVAYNCSVQKIISSHYIIQVQTFMSIKRLKYGAIIWIKKYCNISSNYLIYLNMREKYIARRYMQ